jgi:hypothetical protein
VIVLDTNVLSEMMRAAPGEQVMRWLARQSRSSLYTTALNRAEILYGIQALPHGRQRTALTTAAEAMFDQDFAGRILPFNSAAADLYPEIVLTRRQAGTPSGIFDALVAAITKAAGMSIATRDISGFNGCGLAIIDP